MFVLVFLSLISLMAARATGFYLPGVAPRDFLENDRVDLYVNALTSSRAVA